MKCTYCGHTVNTDTNFCPSCGKELKKKPEIDTEMIRSDVRQAIKEVKAEKKSLDHSAWLHWLIVTIFLLVVTFTMPSDSMIVGLILTVLAGAYTYYIFQGGSFIIVNKYLDLFAKLFTEGYNKKLAEGSPPSKAWIVWAILTGILLLYTFTNKLPNNYLGLVTAIPAGVYTGYLLKGGKYIYVPYFIMLVTFALVAGFFQS